MPPEDNQTVALSTMALGQKALIVAFSFDTKDGERIQDMGLVPGEQVEIVRIGDPIEIKIRGYFLSLRMSEAGRIKVQLFS